MNLAIDIGNTSTKIGVFVQNTLSENHRLDRDEEAISFIRKKKPEHIIISSVKEDLPEFLRLIPREPKILVLDNSTPLPISLAYKTPQTLGTDRISAVVGAYSIFPNSNSLVIDIGTCIKCDLINSENQYLGGSISPGLKMRFEALNHYTSKLPLINYEEINFLAGKSTKESILSGVINGISFEIDGFIEHHAKIFSQLNVIISGGDSYCFESRIKPHIFVVPDLVLLGLHKILIHNLSITSV